MKKGFCLLLALTMVLLFAACGGAASSAAPAASSAAPADSSAAPDAPSGEVEFDGELIFAVCAPMTGDNSEFGLGYRYSVEVMADIWNEKGGLLGKKIVIESFDDKGTPEESANVAQQVVARDDIVCVIGHFSSSCSMAASPIYQENGMLQCSPSSSHADFTKEGGWIWRVSPLSADESRTVAKTVAEYYKSEKPGILILNNDWGLDSSELATEFLKENYDIEVVHTEKVVEGTDDYAAVISNFQNAEVDTIIMCATYPVSLPFINQLKQVMPDVNLIGHGNCFVPQTIEVCGENAEGLVCTASFASFNPDEAVQEYVDRYVDKNPAGTFPIADSAQAYDTAGMYFTCIEKAGSADREAIREQMKTIEMPGVTGLIKFNENRDCSRDYGTVIIENGEWVYLNY